jgi:geranylgeranyl diphosphate synthase type II
VPSDSLTAERTRIQIDEALELYLPKAPAVPAIVIEAMRYSLFAGGKRLRPTLTLAAADAVARIARVGLVVGSAVDLALPAGCAVELIHTYSLIHDDLPALDNDDLRRGRPTCHKVFGEAMAILAGDALLTLAFEVLSKLPNVAASRRVDLIRELATASGTFNGMIGGQVHDIEGEGKSPTAELLESIHRAKTGALLRASVRMGAIFASANPEQLAAISSFGEHVGLAFQIVDDILDVEQPSEALGKTAGKDAQQKKITFPAVYGLEQSRTMAEQERLSAYSSLEVFGQRADRLRQIADLIVTRKA